LRRAASLIRRCRRARLARFRPRGLAAAILAFRLEPVIEILAMGASLALPNLVGTAGNIRVRFVAHFLLPPLSESTHRTRLEDAPAFMREDTSRGGEFRSDSASVGAARQSGADGIFQGTISA
jgi:hypothetical protein